VKNAVTIFSLANRHKLNQELFRATIYVRYQIQGHCLQELLSLMTLGLFAFKY